MTIHPPECRETLQPKLKISEQRTQKNQPPYGKRWGLKLRPRNSRHLNMAGNQENGYGKPHRKVQLGARRNGPWRRRPREAIRNRARFPARNPPNGEDKPRHKATRTDHQIYARTAEEPSRRRLKTKPRYREPRMPTGPPKRGICGEMQRLRGGIPSAIRSETTPKIHMRRPSKIQPPPRKMKGWK